MASNSATDPRERAEPLLSGLCGWLGVGTVTAEGHRCPLPLVTPGTLPDFSESCVLVPSRERHGVTTGADETTEGLEDGSSPADGAGVPGALP